MTGHPVLVRVQHYIVQRDTPLSYLGRVAVTLLFLLFGVLVLVGVLAFAVGVGILIGMAIKGLV